MNLLTDYVNTNGPLIGRRSFVVQIGANDGVCAGRDGVTTTCPVYPLIQRFRWPGILIEPVDWLFQKLRAAYADHDNLAFENTAISDRAGVLPFFRIREDAVDAPWYAHKISGVTDKVIQDELAFRDDLEAILIREHVACETLDAVLERNACDEFDILQIDVEGHDGVILRSLDLFKYQPSIVIFEHKHLDPQDLGACITMLEAAGFGLLRDENDIMAQKHWPR